MKKLTTVLYVALIVLLVAAGCSAKDNGKGSATPSASNGASAPAASPGASGNGASGGEPVDIKLAVWGSGATDAYKKTQDDFNASHPDIRLTIEMQGSYWDYIGAKTASKDLPDLFYLSAWEKVQTYAKNGILLDLSDRPFVGKIYDSLKESISYEGKVYGYPWSVSLLAVIYNEELFAQAGITAPPKTLAEYGDTLAKLKAAGITPWASSVNETWTLAHLFSSYQGQLVKGKQADWMTAMSGGSASFRVDGTDQMFNFLDSMKANTVSNPLDADYNAAVQAMATGKAAMFFEGEWAISDILKANPDAKLNIFGIPISDNPDDAVISIDTGGAIGVNKDSKNLDAALVVLDALTDETNPNGYIAQMASVSAAPTMPTNFSVPMSNAWDTFQSALANGQSTEGWLFQQFPSTTIYEQSGNIMQGYFAGAKNKDQVIKELDQEWKAAMK